MFLQSVGDATTPIDTSPSLSQTNGAGYFTTDANGVISYYDENGNPTGAPSTAKNLGIIFALAALVAMYALAG